MSSNFITAAIPLPQIAVGHASVGASYASGGSFSGGVVYMVFISTLNAAIQVSFDGVNDHIAIPAGSTTPIYFPINFKSNNLFFSSPAIFTKQIGAPSAGTLYVTAFVATPP